MDRTQQIKTDLEKYRQQKTGGVSTGNIKADLEAYRQQKADPAIQREQMIEQGMPVSTQGRFERTGDVAPTGFGNVVRDIAKAPATLLARPLQLAKAIGGATPEEQTIKSKFLGDIKTSETGKDVLADVGRGIETVSLGVGTGAAKTGISLAKQPFKQAVLASGKQLAKEGAVAGGMQGFGRGLQEQESVGDVIGKTAAGIGLGGATGFGLGAGTSALSRVVSPKPVNIIEKKIDNSIRKLYSNTTGDVADIEKMATDTKKGLDLLVQNEADLVIPDVTKPLGSGATKQLDITKASPNELITAVNELQKVASTKARSAVEQASSFGAKLDTQAAKNLIIENVKSGNLPQATGKRLFVQIDALQNDPTKIFDWVQDVNKSWKQDMTKSAKTKQVAEEIAKVLRSELNTLTDRTGYADATAAIQGLKRLLVTVAKQTNKKVNFGDIATDAGIDAAFSLITSNPAYMSRTLGASVLKGLLNKYKKSVVTGNLRSAIKNTGKIPPKVVMPSSELKQRGIPLPAPKEGSLPKQRLGKIDIQRGQRPPIQLPARPQSTIDAEEVARLSNKNTPSMGKTDDLTTSIQKAKASGQSFDEWVKGQPKNKSGFNALDESYKKPLLGTTNKMVTVYRGGGQGELRLGDFVTTNKARAEQYGKIQRFDIPENQLRVADVEGQKIGIHTKDDLIVDTRSQLKAEWDKIPSKPKLSLPNKNATKPVSKTDSLIQEAKKYKSAEEFVDEMRIKDWRKTLGNTEYNDFAIKFREDVNKSGKKIEEYLTDIWNKANKSKLSLKDNRGFISTGYKETGDLTTKTNKLDDKNLIVLHNLSEKNLKYTDKIGGLPVPSIAISRKEFPLQNFGEITLIADKSLIDPSIKTNKAFNADAYSKRFPRTTVDIKNSKPLKELVENVKDYFNDSKEIDWERYSNSADSILGELQDGGITAIENKNILKRAFAIENNISKTAKQSDIDKLVETKGDDYSAFLEGLFSKMNASERIFKGFTYSGRRRYVPATLENFVKEMKGAVKDSENFSYGVPSLRASQSKQFRTLESIKKDRNKIIPKQEMEVLADKKDEEFSDLVNKHNIEDMSQLITNLKDYIAGKISRSNLMDWTKIDNNAVDDFVAFAKSLKDMPTEYFEVKPQRAVGLDEFKIAIVPDDISKKAIEILENKGVLIQKYSKDMPNSRQEVINKAVKSGGLAFAFSPLFTGAGVGLAGVTAAGTLKNRLPNKPQKLK